MSPPPAVRTTPMKPVVVFVALWLWLSSLLAYPTLTVSPDEEDSLNHYVQVLQNVIQSVPTAESGHEKGLDATGPSSSPSEGTSPAAPASAMSEASGSPPTPGRPERTERTTTAFWSIKPNNVSVVLVTDEPYIEEDDPEPEPEPEPRSRPRPRKSTVTPRSPPVTTQPPTSSRITVSTRSRSTYLDISTDSEDVPQLSGVHSLWHLEPHAQDILRKLSDLSWQVRRGPLGHRGDPRYRDLIQASREDLKRSLALAAAAEHRLQKMYWSHVFPEVGTSSYVDDISTVINMLYNSRSKLPDYLDTKFIPSDMKERASTVILILKKTLCLGQVETQSLIRKLLRNNMKILNLLEIT